MQRWPFTAGFIGSMAATIYVSMVLHSYILSVIFAVIQVLFPVHLCVCLMKSFGGIYLYAAIFVYSSGKVFGHTSADDPLDFLIFFEVRNS